MPIRLFNTLTRQKEIFKPLKDKQVGLYCCGPTVYWYSHLGNLRTYIFEDVLRRVLEYNGYKVKHVMNFTDVGHLTSDEDTGEDKMEVGAKRENKTAKEISDFYIESFKKDAASLNIKKPDIYARATEHIDEQIELVKILEAKGFTYRLTDGIYFDTGHLPDYGQLAKLDIEGLKAGARIEQVAGKKHPTDFAVWKFSPAGTKRQQEWESPWAPPGSRGEAKGFPGWHLECSAMSQEYLGKQFDIHCGGIDLIPIHHTNEIAQSQAAFGQIPARFWLHGDFLLVDGAKMAKSTANFLTLEHMTKKFNPLAFRYLTLTAHYRSQLNLTWESLAASQTALNKLYNKIRQFDSLGKETWRLEKLAASAGFANKEKQALLKKTRKYEEDFLQAINDDLDMPKALSFLWQAAEDDALPPAAKKELFLKFDRIFGLGLTEVKPINVPAEITTLAQKREQFRQQKNWQKADELRRELEKESWTVEDTETGPKVRPKE